MGHGGEVDSAAEGEGGGCGAEVGGAYISKVISGLVAGRILPRAWRARESVDRSKPVGERGRAVRTCVASWG